MSKYQAPKRQLHRDFVYLDHETVLNSLSAFEAGRVDEIIQKTAETTDTGIDGGLKAGPAKLGASRKKEAELREELVRKRTWFSAFEGWYQTLKKEEAIGSFDVWDREVRDSLRVGDTIEFRSRVRLSPLYVLFRTFMSFANEAGPTSKMFKVTAQQSQEYKSNARQIESWTRGSDGSQATLVYFEPRDTSGDSPRIVGRIAEAALLRGLGEVDGQFVVIGQIEAVLEEGDEVSAIRVIRDAPITPLEAETVSAALAGFAVIAPGMGLSMTEDDFRYRKPTVVLRPIAIFR